MKKLFLFALFALMFAGCTEDEYTLFGKVIGTVTDATTGEPIAVRHRIGLIDRKLRIIGENAENTGEYLEMAQEAYKSTYAYEWQGDNLLLAREALLFTFIEHYQVKYGKEPQKKSVQSIANIISWNVLKKSLMKWILPVIMKYSPLTLYHK